MADETFHDAFSSYFYGVPCHLQCAQRLSFIFAEFGWVASMLGNLTACVLTIILQLSLFLAVPTQRYLCTIRDNSLALGKEFRILDSLWTQRLQSDQYFLLISPPPQNG